MNSRVPEYACAADGVKVTEPVMLCPGFKFTGKDGPEYENCAAVSEMPEIVIVRLFSFVMVTVCDELVEPTVWLPKLTEVGLTLTFA